MYELVDAMTEVWFSGVVLESGSGSGLGSRLTRMLDVVPQAPALVLALTLP